MGILDEFFGDGRSAPKECLYCGRSDGDLRPVVWDHFGPTHWAHPECRARADERHQEEVRRRWRLVGRAEDMTRNDM